MIITIDETTHPYLMRIAHSYSSHSSIPSRQELMEAQYDDTFYQVSGHLTLNGLTEQVGIDKDDYITQVRKAELIMNRVLTDDD